MRFVLFSSILISSFLAACADDTGDGAGGSGGDATGATTTTTTLASSTSTSTGSGSGSSSAASGAGGEGGDGSGGSPAGTPEVLLVGNDGGQMSDVAVLSSGDYVVAGWLAGYGAVMRLTPAGDVVWSFRVDPGDISMLVDVLVLEDDSVVVSGFVRIDSERLIVARLSADGDVLWQRQAPMDPGAYEIEGTMGRRGDILDFASGHGTVVSLTTDGAFVSGADLAPEPFEIMPATRTGGDGAFLHGSVYVDESDNTRKTWVARLDAEGEIAWQRTVEVFDEVGHMGAPTPDDGFVVAQHGRDFASVTVSRLDADGELSWSRTITRPGGDLWFDDVATSTTEIVLAGYVMPDDGNDGDTSLAVLRLTPDGDLLPSTGLHTEEMTLGRGVEIVDGRPIVVGFGARGGVVVLGEAEGSLDCGDWAAPALVAFEIEDADVTIGDGDVEISPRAFDVADLEFLEPAGLDSSVECAAP